MRMRNDLQPALGAPARQGAEGKEFLFTQSDFERVRRLIYDRAGIALGDGKQEMVYSRLSRRLRLLHLGTFEAYLRLLEADAGGSEWEQFTNALTTNLTSFFREAHHFPVLAEHVKAQGGPIEIWCCASSTGEEPYSLAITLCEAFGTLTPPARILATDIDTQVLAKAESGVYSLERVSDMSPERLKRFFLRGKGPQAGYVRLRPELRRLISFKPLNLLDDRWALKGPFDAVFCRNVMIYFDKPTQGQILSRLAPLLKPSGLLFAGHSENLSFVTRDFSLIGKTVYQLSQAARS